MNSNPCTYIDYGDGGYKNGRLGLRMAVWI